MTHGTDGRALRVFCVTHGSETVIEFYDFNGPGPHDLSMYLERPHSRTCKVRILWDLPRAMRKADALRVKPPGLRWAVKMPFLWRWRLGYWDWEAFRAAAWGW